MRKGLIVLAAVPLVAVGVLGAMLAFGTVAPPPALRLIGDPFKNADYSDLPAVTPVRARDGTSLAVHVYGPPADAGEASRIAIVIHGSSATGSSLHFLAKALQSAGFVVYAPDIRGHGGSGRRGDIDYANQLDDDLADLIAAARAAHPKAELTLVGFSSGGGFALHAAATPLGREFVRTVLVSPMLGPFAPTAGDALSDWGRPYLPRLIAQIILGRFGIHAFDGLPALAFAIAPENASRLTGVYSFRLMMGFGTHDYAADLRNAQSPLSVLVGSNDKLFKADRFAPTVHAQRADVPVAIVPGPGHVEMTIEPAGLAAIVAEAQRKQG